MYRPTKLDQSVAAAIAATNNVTDQELADARERGRRWAAWFAETHPEVAAKLENPTRPTR